MQKGIWVINVPVSMFWDGEWQYGCIGFSYSPYTPKLGYFIIKTVLNLLNNASILLFLFELYFNCMQNVHISF